MAQGYKLHARRLRSESLGFQITGSILALQLFYIRVIL